MSSKPLSVAAASVVFTSVLLGSVHVLRADPPPSFSAGEPLSAAKMNTSFAALATRLDALEKANAARDALPAVPSGTIVAFGGTTPPPGWLACDGAAVDRLVEAALFTAIGTAWGAPDDAKFNVPDLRGVFLRGVAHGKNDPDVASRAAKPGGNAGDRVGSYQGDQLRAHAHSLGSVGFAATPIENDNPNTSGNLISGSIDTPPAGGSETRPVNAYVEYIIKR